MKSTRSAFNTRRMKCTKIGKNNNNNNNNKPFLQHFPAKTTRKHHHQARGRFVQRNQPSRSFHSQGGLSRTLGPGTRAGPLGWRHQTHSQATRAGLSHGTRTHRTPVRYQYLSRNGSTQGASLYRIWHGCQAISRRRHRRRARQDQRPYRLCLFARFHRPGRIALGNARSKNGQGHEHGHESGSARDWSQRLGWSSHSRRCGQFGWLCRRVSTQCRRVGRDSANFGHYGAVCRRCRVQSGHDRFYLHGRRH
mmetsp:Transcript_29641/g.69027  ORF Transcript_29641/g.69027 Transcript_29641/m.69027 type:complete len:251 (-) Transcript_29641:385-1137(-)